MRKIAIILLLASVQGFAQGIDNSKLNEEPALGGIADYDPLLFMMFFEADEVEAIIADPRNEEHPVTSDVSVEKPSNGVGASMVKLNAPKPITQDEAIASVGTPDYVRGYILLDNHHRKGYSRYDLYYEDGGLIESGNVRYKKNIRVPWSAEGTVKLILHSISGSASYFFNASP